MQNSRRKRRIYEKKINPVLLRPVDLWSRTIWWLSNYENNWHVHIQSVISWLWCSLCQETSDTRNRVWRILLQPWVVQRPRVRSLWIVGQRAQAEQISRLNFWVIHLLWYDQTEEVSCNLQLLGLSWRRWWSLWRPQIDHKCLARLLELWQLHKVVCQSNFLQKTAWLSTRPITAA